MTQSNFHSGNWRAALGVWGRGVFMGAADLIPGVSGGTIAFITGIYERLLGSVALFSSPVVWRELLHFQVAAAWRRADGTFLALLLAGIATAVILLGGLLHDLLANHAHLLLGFFFGLVLASAFAVGRELKKPTVRHLAAGMGGFLAALVMVSYFSGFSGECRRFARRFLSAAPLPFAPCCCPVFRAVIFCWLSGFMATY